MSRRWQVLGGLLLLLLARVYAQSSASGQQTVEPAPPAQDSVKPANSEQPAQNPPQPAPATPPQPTSLPALPAVNTTPPPERSWTLLSTGLTETSTTKRTTAVRVLSLLQGESRAVKLGIAALADDKSAVRVAGAFALGELHDKSSIAPLHKALKDKDPSVIIAAANALLKFKDPAAYKIFYAVVTGDMKGGKGLIASQLDELKDPKQMAVMGFEEGIGFIPYAGMGFDAYRAIKKDDSSPTRAAAARALADDPDTVTEDALIQTAVTDKSELVRNAALISLSHRGNPKIIDRLVPALSDEKASVEYTAAATILHLTDVSQKAPAKPKTKRKSTGSR